MSATEPSVITLLVAAEKTGRWDWPVLALELLEEHGRRIVDARPKITHGRHCACSSCACEDWTNADLAPCGMHGSDCPALYQPWGLAGDPVFADRERKA